MQRSSSIYSLFTLIELLVVISIITILFSLLLPVLGRTKTASKMISCINNQKQCFTMMTLYAADYNDWLPGPETLEGGIYYTTGRTWATQLIVSGYHSLDVASKVAWKGLPGESVLARIVFKPISHVFVCPALPWEFVPNWARPGEGIVAEPGELTSKNTYGVRRGIGTRNPPGEQWFRPNGVPYNWGMCTRLTTLHVDTGYMADSLYYNGPQSEPLNWFAGYETVIDYILPNFPNWHYNRIVATFPDGSVRAQTDNDVRSWKTSGPAYYFRLYPQ